MFIYREAYYLERLEPDEGDPRHIEWREKVNMKRNVAEIIIAKQRHGAIGRVEVGFVPARVRFTDLDRKYSVTDNRE
jgi:replicative DNA helicase